MTHKDVKPNLKATIISNLYSDHKFPIGTIVELGTVYDARNKSIIVYGDGGNEYLPKIAQWVVLRELKLIKNGL